MSKMRRFSILPLVCLMAGPALAQTMPDGCFTRTYAQAHLDQHPEQVVERISILFGPYETLVTAEIKVLLADQGHAGRDGFGGRRMSESAANFTTPLQFGIECDGGSFDVIALDANGITIETGYVRVASDGCGGDDSTSLAEAGSALTRYRLERSDLAACEW